MYASRGAKGLLTGGFPVLLISLAIVGGSIAGFIAAHSP